jgi:hypothetical protein
MSGSSSNLKALHVPVFVTYAVFHLTETNLECYFLTGIIVEVKTKGVKTSSRKVLEPPAPATPREIERDIRRFRHLIRERTRRNG